MYALILGGIVVSLAVMNYTQGTYLIGWDNLQTDLNPWLGIERAFFSVWEEYQSFGLLAGMAHGSDLIRAIFIYLLSLVLPQSLLRYASYWIMTYVGAIGVMKLIEYTGFRNEKKYIAWLGALFYILNFARVQIFYFPYDPFLVFYAMLPWELLYFFKYMKGEKVLLPFCVVQLLATPQSYVQTIFVVYMMIIGLMSIPIMVLHRKQIKIYCLRFVLACVVIGSLNAFWILPQAYFVATGGSKIIQEAKANILSSDAVYFENQESGSLLNTLILTGQYSVLRGQNGELFDSWNTYRKNPIIYTLLIIIAGVCISGLCRKSKFQLPIGLIFLLCISVLVTGTPPFSWVMEIIRSNSTLAQIFRSPFSKFVVPYSLIMSILFAWGCDVIIEKCSVLKKMNYRWIVPFCIFLLIVIISLPAWKGEYISSLMRIQIPNDYFQLMNVLDKTDKTLRIALLPDTGSVGWISRKWGYVGSGFLWYGIKQPIISRTFDTLSSSSESYYWEIKNALEAEDIERAQSVWKKYNVSLVLIDSSVKTTINAKALQIERSMSLIKSIPNVKQLLNTPQLALYKLPEQNDNNYIQLQNVLPNIGPSIKITDFDNAFLNNGNYQTDETKNFESYYPFLDFTSVTKLPRTDWQIDKDVNSKLAIKATQRYNTSNSTEFRISEPIATLHTKDFPVKNCEKMGSVSMNIRNDTATISSKDKATACFGFEQSDKNQNTGYVIRMKTKKIKGASLFLYISDLTKDQIMIEEYIPEGEHFLIIPPHFKYGIGYYLSFYLFSYKGFESVATIEDITISPLPYNEIKNFTFKNDSNFIVPITKFYPIDATKNSLYKYTVQVSQTKDKENTLILYQAYHHGWTAYYIDDALAEFFPFIFGREIISHVKINNWANGWTISDEGRMMKDEKFRNEKSKIVLLFWPQYLQYLGFALLLIPIGVLIRSHKKPKN